MNVRGGECLNDAYQMGVLRMFRWRRLSGATGWIKIMKWGMANEQETW